MSDTFQEAELIEVFIITSVLFKLLDKNSFHMKAHQKI